MTTFDHLILTPFNLRIQHAPGLNPDWLRHRFELFERFCYPSVLAQTNQNFKWLLLMDPDTPAEFKQRVERLSADHPRLRPVFTTLADYLAPVIEHADRDATHLITTTLDNDDALGRNFVQRVQDEFRGQEFELVDLVQGYRLQLASGKLYRHRVDANPFISLIERNDSPQTIRGCGPHNQIRAQFDKIRTVEADPVWLQVVHDRNIAATGVWGCRRVDPTRIESQFVIEHVARPQSGLLIGIENFRRGLERFFINAVGERTATWIRRTIVRLRRSLRR